MYAEGTASFFGSACGSRTDSGEGAPGLFVPGYRQVRQERPDANERVSNLKWKAWQVVEGTVHCSSRFNRVRPAIA